MVRSRADLHEGTPLGKTEPRYGLASYISPPKETKSDGKVDRIVFISDIFGIYQNAKLLADEWAGQGYEVLVPELFENGPVDHELLNVSSGSVCVPARRGQGRGWGESLRDFEGSDKREMCRGLLGLLVNG